MCFEFESGKEVDSTKLESVHVADGNLHFWGGSFLYSFHPKQYELDGFISLLNNIDSIPEGDEKWFYSTDRGYSGTNFSIENQDEGQSCIFVDSGMGRFIFCMPTKYVKSLAVYLQANRDE